MNVVREILIEFWSVLAEMSPYLLFGFFVAGLLSMFVSRRMVERHLGGSGVMPVLKAAILGVPLPLCSCGVIPVAMSLYKQGASRGSTISFLLSTPQTGVDSVLVTYSLLGIVFAIVRPVVALVTGLIGGVLVNLFGRTDQGSEAASAGAEETVAKETWKKRFVDGMDHAFVTLPRSLGKPLLLGLVIAALISALVPDDFFTEKLGRGLPAMLIMMVVGIPVYVCASASVPVAAALILKGLSPGAVLVFLMTGPATNAAGLMMIWNALGRRTAMLYLVTVAVCALGSGLLFDAVVYNTPIKVVTHAHEMIPPAVQNAAAVILLALLGYGFYSRWRAKK